MAQLAASAAIAVALTVVSVAAALTPTTGSNRRAAQSDAAALLGLVVPPAGSTVESAAAGTGPEGHHLLTAAFASAWADRTWTVPGSAASVMDAVTSHLPRGLTIVGSGSTGGSGPATSSTIFAARPVPEMLGVRWLSITVATGAGKVRLLARSQSQWLLTRPNNERIPAGVRSVEVTEGMPRHAPLRSRTVTRRERVAALARLVDSLPIIQPGAASCPGQTDEPALTVAVTFRAPDGRVLARVAASPRHDLRAPASLPGWACSKIDMTVLGRRRAALAGDVIGPLERLLHITLPTRG